MKTGSAATALFETANSGIQGNVTIDDRWITIYLDFTHVDWSLLPGGTSCTAEGLHYHIHEMWTYDDDVDRIGSSACGAAYTGGHYDPYLACGPHTANIYCETYDTDECVESSTTYDNKNIYVCNETVYEYYPYACEVGDWSGKYGTIQLIDNVTYLSAGSYWELKSAEVWKKSIVFHCANTDARAFCATFSVEGETEVYEIEQNATAEAILPDTTLGALIEISIGGLIYPGGLFLFYPNGTVAVLLLQFFTGTGVGIGKCSEYSYRIYDSWSVENASLITTEGCIAAAGNFYDPTISCMYDSESSYCKYDYRLCNDSSYSYSCNYTADRYSCAPGDLSGKYGIAKFKNYTYIFSGEDDLLPPLDSLIGKSIGVECASSGELLACAGITLFETTIITNITINNTSPTPEPTPAVTPAPTKHSEGNFYQLNLLTFSMIALVWLRLI